MILRFRRDLTSGIILMVISVVFWFMIPYNIVVTEATKSAQTFPKLLVGFMFLLSLYISLKSLITKKDEILEFDLKKEAKIIGFIISIILYAVLVHFFGFLVGTFAISALTLFIYKARKKLYLVTAICIIVTYLLFVYVLRIPLP